MQNGKAKNIPFEQLLTEHKAEIDWLIKDWIEEETIVLSMVGNSPTKPSCPDLYVSLSFGKALDTHKTKYGKNILYAV